MMKKDQEMMQGMMKKDQEMIALRLSSELNLQTQILKKDLELYNAKIDAAALVSKVWRELHLTCTNDA